MCNSVIGVEASFSLFSYGLVTVTMEIANGAAIEVERDFLLQTRITPLSYNTT